MISRKLTLAFVALLLATGGCSFGLELFNGEFLSQLGLSDQAATLPGAAPSLLVQVENRTSKTIQAVVSYRLGTDEVKSFTLVLAPGLKSGQALICPVSEITLGDVTNLQSVGARVLLGQNPGSAFVEVEPYGVLLKVGANYDCGDGILFAVTPSSATRSGYQTFAYISRSTE